jgi:hypothetical protein
MIGRARPTLKISGPTSFESAGRIQDNIVIAGLPGAPIMTWDQVNPALILRSCAGFMF